MLTKIEPNRIYLNQVFSFGLYFYYWCARSGGEVNKLLNRKVALSAWWFLVPFFGAYWWVWNYAEALHQATGGFLKKSETFLIYIIAINLWAVLFYFPLNILDISNSYDRFSVIAIWSIILVMFLTIVLAFGFFCANIQSKINRLNIRK